MRESGQRDACSLRRRALLLGARAALGSMWIWCVRWTTSRSRWRRLPDACSRPNQAPRSRHAHDLFGWMRRRRALARGARPAAFDVHWRTTGSPGASQFRRTLLCVAPAAVRPRANPTRGRGSAGVSPCGGRSGRELTTGRGDQRARSHDRNLLSSLRQCSGSHERSTRNPRGGGRAAAGDPAARVALVRARRPARRGHRLARAGGVRRAGIGGAQRGPEGPHRLGPRVTASAQDTRSQQRNREPALRRLADRLAAALEVHRPRTRTRPTSSSRRKRLAVQAPAQRDQARAAAALRRGLTRAAHARRAVCRGRRRARRRAAVDAPTDERLPNVRTRPRTKAGASVVLPTTLAVDEPRPRERATRPFARAKEAWQGPSRELPPRPRASVRAGSPETAVPTGSSSAPVQWPHPSAPLSCMELDSAGPAAALPKSSSEGRGRPAAPGTRKGQSGRRDGRRGRGSAANAEARRQLGGRSLPGHARPDSGLAVHHVVAGLVASRGAARAIAIYARSANRIVVACRATAGTRAAVPGEPLLAERDKCWHIGPALR